MFIPDMPNVPPQDVPVMIAQANQAQSSTALTVRTVGICYGIPNGVDTSPTGGNVVDPREEAHNYLFNYEKKNVANTVPTTVTILQQPAHGILRLITQADIGTILPGSGGTVDPANPGYIYLPEKGYIGQDKAVVLVEIGGVKVKEIFYFHDMDERTSPCNGGDGIYSTWKISSTLDASGNSTLTSVDYLPSLTTAATPQPNYLLTGCAEIESTGPSSAGRAVSPAGLLSNYLNNNSEKQIVFNLTDIKNITLLQGTTHGKIITEVDNTGLTSYGYVPEPNYVGNDKAVFMAEFKGKVYKIVINFVVSLHVGESPLMEGEQPVCPEPTLIKLNPKPALGSLGIDLGAITVTVADLPNAAVGQTTGTAITLDANAAGYGWYIDPNPAANTDFLPTADPTVWIAAPGSAAAG